MIQKGVPLHVGVVFHVGAPILNPVVFASTYYAFQSNLEVWVKVTGTISTTVYHNFQIPSIQVETIEKIPQPDDPYVYEVYESINLVD